MARLLAFATALLFLLSVTSAKYCFPCQFKFCNGRQIVYLGKPDTPLRGPICKNDGTKIGIFNTGEAMVYSQTRFGYDPISKSHPPGLEKNFAPTLFKGYPVSHYFPKLRKKVWFSGVGHQNFHFNQREKIKGQCIILSITSYQVLDDKYNIVDNVNGAGPWHDSCIDFYVY